MQKCTAMMKLDHNVLEVPNSMGELCSHYPQTILIPESVIHHNGTTSQQQPNRQQQQIIYESTYDANKLRDLFEKARFAR